MKKLMMMALFAIMTTATFAQDAAKQILVFFLSTIKYSQKMLGDIM